MSKRVFKTELDAVNNSLQVQVNNSISKNIVDAKGDIVTASAADTPIRLAVGTNEQRLVVDSATTSGLKYVADTTNYAVGAKGDLLAGTAADTVSALTVGANGETLVADSSTSTGLRYNPQNALANPFINGGFDFFQRSGTPTTGITVTGGYAMTIDRWWGRTATGGGSMIVSQQSAQDANLPNIRYCVRSRRATSNSDTGGLQLWTFFETSNSIPFSGKAVTVSFYARKAAGFTGAFDAQLFSGTGTDQNELSGTYTGRTTVASGAHTLTTSWQRFVITGTIASTATELGFIFSHNPTGTAGSDDYYEVTGVQLDLGTYTASSAPTFRRSGGTLAGELAACQRYYYRSVGNSVNAALTSWGMNISTTEAVMSYPLPVQMRVKPASIDYATIELTDFVNEFAISSATIYAGSTPNIALISCISTGLTQYRPSLIRNDNNAAGYIGFSAEL